MDMVEQGEDESIADAYLQSAYDETGLNGTEIDWRYWVHQMPVLSAAQAACLISALEPDLYASLNGRHGQDDPAPNIAKARKIQQLAEANGKLTASPDEWIAWAKSMRISVHIGFLLAVGERKALAASGAPKKVEPPVSSNDWKKSARAIADECFDNDTANNCRDRLAGYSRRVMDEMQERKIHGPRGLIDNPNTIQREALQGAKWWAKKTK